MNNKINEILNQLELQIIGRRHVLKMLMVGVLGNGHVLLEDLPGMGKTAMIKSLAQIMDLENQRVQGTPDVLPADIVGFNLFNPKTQEFEYRKGVWDTTFLLVDEINRMSPRTQSSLLEMMEERQVSVEGTTYKVSQPFIVFATQNPYESSNGTYPLPEAQLDRFFMRLALGYPTTKQANTILMNFIHMNEQKSIQPVIDEKTLLQMQQEVKAIRVEERILNIIVEIVEKTRSHPIVKVGVSTRGSISLLRAVQAHAYIEGRSYALPDDIKSVCKEVLSHRLVLEYDTNIKQQEKILEEILEETLLY